MKLRLPYVGLLALWMSMVCLILPEAVAFRAEEGDSAHPRFTYGLITSQPNISSVQSSSGEESAAHLETKGRSLLSSKYGASGDLEMDPVTGVVRRLRGVSIAKGMKGTASPGDKDSLLRQFVDENTSLFGMKSSNLELRNQTEKQGRSYFVFQQKVDGIPLYGAFLKASLDSQGNLLLLDSSCWPAVKYTSTVRLTGQEIASLSAKRIVSLKKADEIPRYQLKSSEKVLFPLSTPQGTLFQVAYRQVIHTRDPLGDWVTVVDANSGREYVRYNNYRFATIDGTVQGEVLPSYYNDSLQGLPFENESVHSFSQTPAYFWDLATDPGWSKQGLWAFGVPNGEGGDAGDRGPSTGHTGSHVLGFNLTGGYPNDMAVTQYLTTNAINCATLAGTHLSFWRWLGIESSDYDDALIEVSNNGSSWGTVWSSYSARVGSEWEYCVYDISATADGKSTVYIRWGMGPTDSAVNYAGLYLDDISILAGGGTALTSESGGFSAPAPTTGTSMIHSELKGPYSDVVNEDGPRLRFNHTAPSNPAGWNWTIPDLNVVQSWNLDTNPGWAVTGDWAWGIPLGIGGDPSQGQTGQHVYGYKLSGSYSNDIVSQYYLTTPALNCSSYTGTHLRFWRWLGVESRQYDSASIQISNDNAAWYTVYQNPTVTLQDTAWRQVTYNISAIADGKSAVYIRWSLGPTDDSVSYSGWNIDDVELLAASSDPDFTVGLYDTDEANVFHHMGVAHESIKGIDPAFTGVDHSMPAVVRVGSDYANAYFDGLGLNFGEGDGTSFRNLAQFADVVYHEYAHAVTHSIYPDDLLPYSGETGAMDEAWSDYFACTITGEPMIGEGGLLFGSPWLRNMDNDLVVPDDLELEVHNDGRIIGAGLWSLRVLLGKTLADHLIHFARFNLAGSFLDYYEDLLLTDDTDSNLQNGTPHMLDIAKAFGPHGIGGLRVESMSQEASNEVYVNEKLDAGESGVLLPQVTSHFVAGNVQLSAQTTSPYLNISDGNVSYGALGYSETVTKSADTLAVSISPSCPEDEILPVIFTLTTTDGYSSRDVHRLINAPDQILYDDGAVQGTLGYGGEGGGFAVRFTPSSYPATITTLRLMTEGPFTGVDPVLIQVKVWDDDGAEGRPGTPLTPSKQVNVPFTGAWFEIPLVFDQHDAVYTWNMESDLDWTAQSGWQRGIPTGLEGDPSSAYSGTSIFGYNLSGTYQDNLLSARYLTTNAIDCSALEGTTLEFQRWLGVENSQYDHASIEVSDNGTLWTKIWENGETNIVDTQWNLQSYDISAIADGKQTVYVRWGMGPTDNSLALCGWNLDDVVIKSKTGVINGITVSQGDVFVGWLETGTAYYNGVTWKRPDDRGWVYDADKKQWFTLSSVGYPMDLMVRVRYDVPTGVQVWSEY
jgi:hypothetical protein